MKKVIKLMAVGDIMTGDLPVCFGHGVQSKIERHGPLFPFLNVSSILNQADITFGNLESVLSRNKKRTLLLTKRYLRGNPTTIIGLKKAGFNILSLANNHMMQHGEKAFLETIRTIEKNQILCVGVRNFDCGRSIPQVIETKGITVRFLGYSLRPEEYCKGRILYAQAEEKEIKEDIKSIKKEADLVVLSLHWGDEFINRPSPLQIKMAHSFIDAGADVILGHHPHVLQGLERYKNGLIAYSLGNFVFDMWEDQTKKSMILEVQISNEGIAGYKILPIYINKDFQPEILNDEAGKELLDEIDRLSSMIGKTRSYNVVFYQEEVKKYFDEHRRNLKAYYLKNILKLKYNFFYLLQYFLIIIIRRILKKHI